MPVLTYGSGSGIIVVPLKKATPNWKVEIDGQNVTNYLINARVDLPLNRVRSSNFSITNPDGRFTNELLMGDIVKVYADFDDGTTQIFEGRIIMPSHKLSVQSGLTIDIFSLGYGMDALKRKVTYYPSSDDTISNIFKYLRDTYLPNHSSDNTYITTISTTYKPTWSGRPLWNCFQDLMTEASDNYYFYCDINKIWHLVQKGSIIASEAIVFGDNVKEFNSSHDLSKLVNKYYVYGKDLEGIPIVKMKEDTITQSQYGFVAEEIIKDSNLTTTTQIGTKATNLLSKNTTLEQYGSSTCLGMPTLNSGDDVLMLVPFCNVAGTRRIASLTHTLDAQNGFLTIITFNEEEKGASKYMEIRIIKEQELTDVENKYNMENSYAIVFDTYTGLESTDKVIVWDEHLLLDLGETEGTAITEMHETDEIITQLELKVSGSNFASDAGEEWVIYQISCNNGTNWQTVSKDTLVDVSATGKYLKVKITINSLTTKIRAIGILYK